MKRKQVYDGFKDLSSPDDRRKHAEKLINEISEKTLEELKKVFAESLQFHIEGCVSDGDQLPEWVVNGEYEIEYEYTTSALLQKFDGILTRSALARVTGINGHRKPRHAQREKIISGFHKLAEEFQSVV